MWSPTQNLGSHPWDLAAGIPHTGKLFILEYKAPTWRDATARVPAWPAFPVDGNQLRRYNRWGGHVPLVYYVLPLPPWHRNPAEPLPSEAALRLPTPLTPPPHVTWSSGCEEWFFVVPAMALE